MSEQPPARYFSLEEAERTLPLVRRIVEDITREYGDVAPMAARLQALGGDADAAARDEVEERLERLGDLVSELHELGCLFKGFEEGLVDWYSLYAGRPVFLCWKLGEPRIEWWHQVDAGFVGRQPILDSQRGAFHSDAPARRG